MGRHTIGGTVTTIEFNYGGDTWVKVTNLELNASFVESAVELGGSWAFIAATNLNDTVIGSYDDEVLYAPPCAAVIPVRLPTLLGRSL